MTYKSMRDAIHDLASTQQIAIIAQECEPHLVMPALQRQVYALGGPAIYYSQVRNSPFPAVSNLFGTLERAKFLFRHSLSSVEDLIRAKGDPGQILKNPSAALNALRSLPHALPRTVKKGPIQWGRCQLAELPQIHCWPEDGGPFLTLPLVYSEDPSQAGWQKSNLGMYRVQIAGNDFLPNECGLHYQIHRGIAAHHQKALQAGQDFRISIFLGGPPSLSLAAVMPLPEGIPELAFAGALGGRAVRLIRENNHVLAADADFCIVGRIQGLKAEGPFGDHLGYYSLKHDFPRMIVEAVYHRADAIYPFTVVGRPPQEDTTFGALIHELTGSAISSVLPGVQALHAVDVAGVHPLLLAIGSERYQPWGDGRPMELLTQANAILGFGQTSLAKYLFLAAQEDNPPEIHHTDRFLIHVLERLRLEQDLHFHTRTTIDTLDYSGSGLNQGSKLVLVAAGAPVRTLAHQLPNTPKLPSQWGNARMVIPGIAVVQGPRFGIAEREEELMENYCTLLNAKDWEGIPLLVLVDDANFCAQNVENFLWVCFTRSNPSHDLFGVDSYWRQKHWACKGPLVIDARIKPHHAPPLIENDLAETTARQIILDHPLLRSFL